MIPAMPAAEPDGRTMLVRFAGDIDGIEDLLAGVLATDPEDAAASALLGSHLAGAAWKIRTAQRAEHVSQDQFRRFHAGLRRAEQVLIDGAARHPADPAIWTQRLMTARGLGLGLSEVQRRYDRVAAVDPHHLHAQTHLLQSLCPKWSGTFEQVHAFARDRMLAAPKGAPNAVLVVQGHLEHWGELPSGQDRDYLAGPAVRNEIYEAATRSVWDPGFTHGPGWVMVRNTFALVFSLMSDERAAAAQFQAVGPHDGASPWNQFFGDAAAEFVQRRNRAYAKAGVR
jgi:hypothetical protein